MNYELFKKNKKIVAGLIIFVVLFSSFSPLFARKAEAQWVDVVQATKEMGLDTIAYLLVNTIIHKLAASTVNWINSGFQGSPAYVTDPQAYFLDISDKVAGQYIFSNPNLNFLCGPISAKIRLALARSYINERSWQCTLTEVGRNMEDFMGDFSKGGWDSFFEITQNQHMNPIGAYLQAENELAQKLETKTNEKMKELDWGQGFMSWKECDVRAPDTPAQRMEVNGVVIETPAIPGQCLKESTATPGSTIQKKLDSVLGTSENRIVAGDEINEIISALISQLTNQIIGGIGRGLRGMSNSNPTSGGTSFADQLDNYTSSQNYFGTTPDTSILDTPPPDPNTSVINVRLVCDPNTDPDCSQSRIPGDSTEAQ